MRVTAIKEGQDGKVVRRVGEEFDMPEGSKGSWFVPVPAEPKPAGKKAKADQPAESDVA